MLTIENADIYIQSNVIEIADWVEADVDKKQRILNTASRILASKYQDLIIPDDAVYEFSAVLATATNDTNKLQAQGIESFSIDGVGSFKFNRSINDFAELIPQSALDIISIENGISLSTSAKAPLWTVI